MSSRFPSLPAGQRYLRRCSVTKFAIQKAARKLDDENESDDDSFVKLSSSTMVGDLNRYRSLLHYCEQSRVETKPENSAGSSRLSHFQDQRGSQSQKTNLKRSKNAVEDSVACSEADVLEPKKRKMESHPHQTIGVIVSSRGKPSKLSHLE